MMRITRKINSFKINGFKTNFNIHSAISLYLPIKGANNFPADSMYAFYILIIYI